MLMVMLVSKLCTIVLVTRSNAVKVLVFHTLPVKYNGLCPSLSHCFYKLQSPLGFLRLHSMTLKRDFNIIVNTQRLHSGSYHPNMTINVIVAGH